MSEHVVVRIRRAESGKLEFALAWPEDSVSVQLDDRALRALASALADFCEENGPRP